MPLVAPAPTTQMVMVVGFSTTTSWISRTIRWATKSTVSHAYMRFTVAGQDIVLHADYRGIEALGPKTFRSRNQVISEFVVDLPWQPLLPEIIEYLGTPYDYWGLLGQGVMTLGRWLGQHWENPLQDEYQWYCSEFVAYLLEQVGEKLPAKPSAISPAVLLGLMLKSSHATRLPDVAV